MSNLTLALGRPTLADRIFTRSIATDAVLVVAGAALTAALAQVAVPLWPVPITGQTLAVLLVGSSLGALRASLSMVLYAVLGIVGLPVFSAASHGWGVVAGPTGGYIIGFIFAAGLTGWLAQRSWDRRFLAGMLSFLAGSAVVFAFGLPWLAVSLGLNLEQTLQAGLYPFIIGGIIKAIIAAAVMSSAWFLIDRTSAASDTKNAAE
ncbi:MAG: biotin transport system substrate-specific component [Microbacteriaceae bacterium]|jgi:biotin transport system substrate-specific component|nr:biotin transport system substrate-specific component [Microbacteriaceae bacterium]